MKKKGPANKQKKIRRSRGENPDRLIPCPVCGLSQFWEYADESSACPVCGWVHDRFQEARPDEDALENEQSLNEARALFQERIRNQSFLLWEEEAYEIYLSGSEQAPQEAPGEAGNDPASGSKQPKLHRGDGGGSGGGPSQL